MPVTSTKTTTIPGLPAPSSPDLIGYELHTSLRLTADGVTGGAMVKMQAYRANPDGTNPLAIGPAQMLICVSDLYAQAASDAALTPPNTQLAAILTAIQAYVQSLVTAKGL